MIRGLGLQASLISQEGDKVWRQFSHAASDLINLAYVMKSQKELWTPKWAFLIGEHIDILGG